MPLQGGVPGQGFRVSDFVFRVSDFGFRIGGFVFQRFALRILGYGGRVQGSGVRVYGLEFRHHLPRSPSLDMPPRAGEPSEAVRPTKPVKMTARQ